MLAKKKIVFLFTIISFILLGIVVIIISINFAATAKAERMLVAELGSRIREPYRVYYRKPKVNVLTKSLILNDLVLYDQSEKCLIFRVEKAVFKNFDLKHKVPLFGKISLFNLSTSKKIIEDFFIIYADAGSYAYCTNYFEQDKISIELDYRVFEKQKILYLENLEVGFGDKVNFKTVSIFSNFSFADFQQEYSEFRPHEVFNKIFKDIVPLLTDTKINIDFNNFNIKELLLSAGINKKTINNIYKTALFPETFNINFSQHYSVNVMRKNFDLDEFVFQFEPGFLISMQLGLENFNINKPQELSESIMNDYSLVLEDRNGLQVTYQISADIMKISESEIRAQLVNAFEAAGFFFNTDAEMKKNLKSVKDFLISPEKNKISLSLIEGQKIKLKKIFFSDAGQVFKTLSKYFIFE